MHAQNFPIQNPHTYADFVQICASPMLSSMEVTRDAESTERDSMWCTVIMWYFCTYNCCYMGLYPKADQSDHESENLV